MSSYLQDLVDILRGERSRSEIELITDEVRQKIFEENRIRDFDKLIAQYKRLFNKYEKLQRSLALWQGIAIASISVLLSLLFAVAIWILSVLLHP